MRAERFCLASCVLAVSLFAASRADAHCRTHTISPGPDAPVGQCPDQGLPLYWKNVCVGYSLSKTASTQVKLEDATGAASRAFAHWSGVSCDSGASVASIKAQDLGPVDCNTDAYVAGAANQNVIFFADDAWPYGSSTLGKTFVTFDADTGEIFDVDMAIDTLDYRFSTTDPVPENGYDLESIITHEAGHFLGLAHSDEHDAVMYPSYNPGDTSLRNLTPDDVAGLCDVYRPNGDRAVLDDVGDHTLSGDACDATPLGGFGSQCPTPRAASSVTGCATSPGDAPASSLGFVFAAIGAGFWTRRRKRLVRS
jgi:MYXO-CTERM domain-containing protein